MEEAVSSLDMEVCFKKGLIVASVYMNVTKTIHSLLEYRDMTESDLIICADSNASSHMWGCEQSSKRREDMERFLYQHGLVVANRGSPNLLMAPWESIIDVSLTD